MEILRTLQSPAAWQEFYDYKSGSGHLSRQDDQDLLSFIQGREYEHAVSAIVQGAAFPPPRKACISKMHSEKKRTVYIFPREENYVLKHLTHLLHRKYDHLFASNLYSFRPGTGVRDAILSITTHPGIGKFWCYKADIRNYFNSIPIPRLLPMVREVLFPDPEICSFLTSLLSDPWVLEGGNLIREEKGIMAGAPVSTFLADLYLSRMDHFFQDAGILYARYSDDIILFAPTREALDQHIITVRGFLEDAGLAINPDKEAISAPGEPWIFLGVSYSSGVIDVAPASVEKLKAKMRRKTRALIRWQARKHTTGENAAKAFIRSFRRKLFDNPSEHELTWTRWYFPLINTAGSLHILDQYAQSCIRYLVTGKRTKASFNCRYEDMKALGYISLVNSYYRHRDFPENEKETVD